nr:hypothetical protein [Fusobacterium nucleatum]
MEIDNKVILKRSILIFIVFHIYFYSTILSNYFQHYEYIFTDRNHIKKYEVFSDIRTFYGYIDLEDGMYPEGQVGDFRIKEVYEDKNYFIGYDFENNYKTNKIEKRHYIVIDKNKATMKTYNEKDFKEKYENIYNKKFIDIYTFLKRKGTKIGKYR